MALLLPSLSLGSSPVSGASASLAPVAPKQVLGAATAAAPKTVYGPPGPPAGYVAPASSGTSGGGGTGLSSIQQQLAAQAQLQAQHQAQAAQDLYNQRATALQGQLSDLGYQKQSLLDQIGSQYNDVRQQAQDTLNANLASLNQAKTDATTGYENLKGDQGRALADTERQNRVLARANGDLGSSFYEGLQSQATENADQNVVKIGQTEQSQLDQIGQQIVSQNTDYGTKVSQLNDAQTAAQNNVIQQYQSAYNQIQNALSGNNSDKVNALNAIYDQTTSTLNGIAQTFASYKQAAAPTNPIASIASQAGNLAKIDSSYVQPIQNQAIASQLAQNALTQLGQGSSLDNIVGYLNTNSPDKQTGQDALQQFLGYVQQAGGSVNYSSSGTPTLSTPTTGGFFGIGASPTTSIYTNYAQSLPQVQVPSTQSLLSQLLGQYGY